MQFKGEEGLISMMVDDETWLTKQFQVIKK